MFIFLILLTTSFATSSIVERGEITIVDINNLTQSDANFSALIERYKFVRQNIEEDLLISPILFTNNTCEIGPWNNLTTETLPLQDKYDEWRNHCPTCVGLMPNDWEMRLISAFVYSDYIAVVTSLLGRKNFGKQVYCHYYDCNRKLIATFKSVLFPMSTVRCVRKLGAEYISLTLEASDEPEKPIPIINRVSEPKYEIGVCMGQVYGAGSRSMDITEFIEHHQLIGASYFYLTIFNGDDATIRVIHDYERLGLLDSLWIHLKFEKQSLFHLIQVADCFYRSRMHSRWTINIDHDERFIMKNPQSLSQLLIKLPESVVGLSFPVARIQVNDDVLPSNVTYFETYKKTSRPLWHNLKSIYKHQYSHISFYHWSWRTDPGYRVITLNSTVGYFRHYRYTSNSYADGEWQDFYKPFEENKLNPEFADLLKNRIASRLNYALS